MASIEQLMADAPEEIKLAAAKHNAHLQRMWRAARQRDLWCKEFETAEAFVKMSEVDWTNTLNRYEDGKLKPEEKIEFADKAKSFLAKNL